MSEGSSRGVSVAPGVALILAGASWIRALQRPFAHGQRGGNLVDPLATALDGDSWESFARGSAIRREGRAGFARNVFVALGDWPSPDAVPALVSALSDMALLVRGQAA